MAAFQRIKQGIRALFSFAIPVDRQLVASVLNAEQLALFQQMQRSEQLHSINVLRTLKTRYGEVGNDLAVAALLHDVGKSHYSMRIWQKTLTVLVRRFVPHLYRYWVDHGSIDDRFAQVAIIAQFHPQWSVALAQQADTTECALWLIEHHADEDDAWRDHPHAELLTRLMWADDMN